MGTIAAACCGKRAKSGPGRPRDPAKQDAILCAARVAFLERGFNASTIEDIAARAGVSKVTLYNRFGDKETLFEAVIRSEIGRMTTALEMAHDGRHTLPERLNVFGESLLTFLFDRDHVGFDRMFAQEISQLPGLAERFFRAGPGHCRQQLAAELARAHDEGELDIDDPMIAAEDLLSLWKGFGEVELKFGICVSADHHEIRARAERGTATFLRAYGARVDADPTQGDCR